MFKKTAFSTITIFLLTTTVVHAVGVSVVPSKLKVESTINEIKKIQITIKNPSSKVSIYDVYADDFQSWIALEPSSFTLEAGETKKVALSIKPQQQGIFSTNISVVARPLSPREFQANSGVKVSLQIKVSENTEKYHWLTITNSIYVIDGLLGFVLVITLATRRKRSEN
jgi:hypothetical protein